MIHGKKYQFAASPLDEALRTANPDAPALAYTAALDVEGYAAGGTVPHFTFPEGNVRAGQIKPPAEDYQFLSVGGPVPKFADRSALGATGGSPGIVVYHDPLTSYSIPGVETTGLRKSYGGGFELELGRAPGTTAPTVFPETAVGENILPTTELYMPGTMNMPDYRARFSTNVRAIADALLRRRRISSRSLTREEEAEHFFGKSPDGKSPDDFTPGGDGPTAPGRDPSDDLVGGQASEDFERLLSGGDSGDDLASKQASNDSTPDEDARFIFGKSLDELTPAEKELLDAGRATRDSLETRQASEDFERLLREGTSPRPVDAGSQLPRLSLSGQSSDALRYGDEGSPDDRLTAPEDDQLDARLDDGAGLFGDAPRPSRPQPPERPTLPDTLGTF